MGINVKPDHTVAIEIVTDLLKRGTINEDQFFCLTSCLRAAKWAVEGADAQGR
jgi:hypothetical protein